MQPHWQAMLIEPTWVRRPLFASWSRLIPTCLADVLTKTKIIQQIRMVQHRLNLAQYTEVTSQHISTPLPSRLHSNPVPQWTGSLVNVGLLSTYIDLPAPSRRQHQERPILPLLSAGEQG
jgi:hypothetical protein